MMSSITIEIENNWSGKRGVNQEVKIRIIQPSSKNETDTKWKKTCKSPETDANLDVLRKWNRRDWWFTCYCK